MSSFIFCFFHLTAKLCCCEGARYLGRLEEIWPHRWFEFVKGGIRKGTRLLLCEIVWNVFWLTVLYTKNAHTRTVPSKTVPNAVLVGILEQSMGACSYLSVQIHSCLKKLPWQQGLSWLCRRKKQNCAYPKPALWVIFTYLKHLSRKGGRGGVAWKTAALPTFTFVCCA